MGIYGYATRWVYGYMAYESMQVWKLEFIGVRTMFFSSACTFELPKQNAYTRWEAGYGGLKPI